MYESFYDLSENPFSILPDPAYLYLGKQHSLAYTMLVYGVEHGGGFTVVTGDVGCGKTILVRHLLNHLGRDVTIGLISNTQREIGELLKWVLLSFDQPYDATDKVALFDQWQKFLVKQYREGLRTVLIIDEAQNLAGVTLEELRMLSNINSDKNHLLHLVLVGQPQLKELLRHRDLEQFVQRISSDFHLGPLTPDEVPQYVNHRLGIAGREAMLFDDAAMSRIARVSRGVPRKINALCDTALVYGFALEAEIITAEIIEEVLRDKARNGIFGPSSAANGVVGSGNARAGAAGRETTAEFDRQSARLLFPSLSDKK